jgi:hypothetical protein
MEDLITLSFVKTFSSDSWLIPLIMLQQLIDAAVALECVAVECGVNRDEPSSIFSSCI